MIVGRLFINSGYIDTVCSVGATCSDCNGTGKISGVTSSDQCVHGKTAPHTYYACEHKLYSDTQETHYWCDHNANGVEHDISAVVAKPSIASLTSIQTKTVEAVDSKGNLVTVPGGFKFAGSGTDTVEDGIVIQDNSGNQLVWIPVSNVFGDNNDSNGIVGTPILKKDGSKVEITLGRYTFATTSPGTPTLVQKGLDYKMVKTITEDGVGYKELYTHRDATQTASGTNATAYNLEGFINSVNKYHGYYLGRYEASFARGSGFGIGSSNYKPQVKQSTTANTNSMSYTAGRLWIYITQGNASLASRNMYNGNAYVESDLVNSYMWDTAMVFIHKMGNTNYANAYRATAGNTTIKNTGTAGDEKCHIFDMAGNMQELSTETASDSKPCVYRGGAWSVDNRHVSSRVGVAANYGGGDSCSGFRPGLYVK